MQKIKTLSALVFVLLSTLTSYAMDTVGGVNSIVDSYGHTRLHIAAQKGDVTAAKKLIESGADVNLTDNNGETPLHLAACKNVECVELLIHAGSDINKVDVIWGWTPLHWAVALGKPDCLKALIAAGADINKQASEKCNGYTPLCLAASVHNWQSVENKKSVEILISAGAQITKTDLNGNPPLYAAITNMHYEIAQILIERYLESALEIPLNNYSLPELNKLLDIANKIKIKRLERLMLAIEQFIQKIITQISNQSSTRSKSVLLNLNQQNPTQRS